MLFFIILGSIHWLLKKFTDLILNLLVYIHMHKQYVLNMHTQKDQK